VAVRPVFRVVPRRVCARREEGRIPASQPSYLVLPTRITRPSKPAKRTPLPKLVHQFLVVLSRTDPLVWRRIQVPEKYSFCDLHVAIQDATCGWTTDEEEKADQKAMDEARASIVHSGSIVIVEARGSETYQRPGRELDLLKSALAETERIAEVAGIFVVERGGLVSEVHPKAASLPREVLHSAAKAPRELGLGLKVGR
jgi:hypothetical protein